MDPGEAGARPVRLRTHLVRGTLGSFVVVAASRFLEFVSVILLARLLSPESYGAYATAVAIVTVLGVPTVSGLPTMLVRFVAAYEQDLAWAHLRGVMRWALRVGLGVALTLTLGATVVMLLVRPGLSGGFGTSLALALVLLPVLTVTAIHASILRGLRYVVLGQVPLGVLLPGAFMAILVVWTFAARARVPATAEMAVGVRVASAVVALAIGGLLLLFRLPKQVKHVAAEVDRKNWLRAALPLLLLGGLEVVNGRTDVLMLAALKGTRAAGLFQAAARGADLAAFGLMVVSAAIQPTLARLHAVGDVPRLQAVIAVAARVATAVALPTAIAFIGLGGPILSAAFGAEYVQGAGVLAILSGAQVVNAAMGPVGLILNMTGHERLAVQGLAVGAVANVLLNLALIPLWGTTGAAVATAVSLVLWNVVQSTYVRRRLGLRPSVIGALRLSR